MRKAREEKNTKEKEEKWMDHNVGARKRENSVRGDESWFSRRRKIAGGKRGRGRNKEGLPEGRGDKRSMWRRVTGEGSASNGKPND